VKDNKHTDNNPVKGYFEVLEEESKSPIQGHKVITKTDSSDDNRPYKEQDELFKGDLSDFEVWLKHEEFRLRKKDRESERNLREENAKKAYSFSQVWAVFIGSMIVCKGFLSDLCIEIEMFNRVLKVENIFKLETAEFLFIIGTLTGSIFAFYVFVLRYLFYRQGIFDDDKKDT